MMKKINFKTMLLVLSAVYFVFFSINKAYSQEMPADYPFNKQENTYEQYTDESDVYYKRGMEFLKSNQYTKAIDSMEKALSIAPDRVLTRINLAVVYINRGTYFYNQKDYINGANDYRNAIYLLKYDNFTPNSDMAAENLGIAKTDLDNLFKSAQISSTKPSRLKIARELRGQGKFRESLVEFYESLAGNQTDLPIYTSIGDIYTALQNDRNAAKCYQKAITFNADNVELHLKLAKSLHNSGDIENAVKEYNLALNTAKEEDKTEVLTALEEIWVNKLRETPNDATAHMNLGVVLQKKGDLEGALREYGIATNLNPEDITTRLNIGTLYQANKDYISAVRAYDTILQVKPDDVLTHYYRGTALKEMGQPEEAIKEFQIVLSKDPGNINAKDALFETIKLIPGEDITSVYKTFADNNPTDAYAQYKCGFQMHAVGRFDEALVYYKKAITLDPKIVDAYLNLATIYKKQNKIFTAISTLESGLKAVPKNQKINDMLLSFKSESATSIYQDAIKKHTEGKYDEAIKEYLSVIQVSEPNADLYVNLGAAYQAAKKLPEAANAYTKATQIDSKNSTAFYYLGTVYSAQNKHSEAVKALQKALTLDPANDEIKLALEESKQAIKDNALQKGINEFNKGKYNEALLTFNTLSIKDPTNGDVYYYRGMVYDSLKKYQLAIADYKLAIKYKPELNYAYYAVAVDYDTLRNTVEAKRWYNAFIIKSGGSVDQYVKYAKDRVKQLK